MRFDIYLGYYYRIQNLFQFTRTPLAYVPTLSLRLLAFLINLRPATRSRDSRAKEKQIPSTDWLAAMKPQTLAGSSSSRSLI